VATAILVLLCTALTFVPIHWVHPVRVQELRPLTAFVAAMWAAAAVWIVASGLPASAGPLWLLTACGLYGCALTALRTWREKAQGGPPGI